MKCKYCSAEHTRNSEFCSNNCLSKQYYKDNKDRVSERNRVYKAKYRAENKEKIKEEKRLWRLKNKEKLQTYKNNYKKNRYASDPVFKLSYLLRSRLNTAINRGYNGGKAIRNLGCSIEELMKHLESQFQHGMNWNNHGEWHIDHIQPLAKFDLTDEEQLSKACHYTNLQPLWAKDNISKGDK